jgi:hypothetical protein
MFNSRQLTGFLAIAMAIGTLSVRPSYGQSQAINGSIRGRVTDQGNAAIAQAEVKIENTRTGLSKTAETGDDGYYVFPNLPLGSYTVTVQKEGFDTERHPDVVLDAGLDATIDAQLHVGAVTTSRAIRITSFSFNPASAGTPIRNSASRDCSTPMGFRIA